MADDVAGGVADGEGFVEKAVGITSQVILERGHWTVFLDISFWNEGSEDMPIRTVRRRISTYPTKQRAEIAASFMVRAAARDLPHPNMGI